VVPSAQPQAPHLNPVIAKLAEGKTVYGLITGDLSVANARETAQAPVDFVYVDMEHNPLDFPALNILLLAMADRGAVLKKGNLQPNVALFARFPPEADDSQWVVKQALDIGLHGVIFNGVDTPEQALFAVRTMRYPQMRDAKYRAISARSGSWPRPPP
jgi:2-keto-3-deoxy-L-rhamnonate aldolase RhmA